MQSPDQPTNHGHRPADEPRAPSSGDNRQSSTGDALRDVKASGEEKIEHYRGAAADKVDSLADSARAAASELDDGGIEEQFSQQLDKLAKGMGNLSSAMRDKSGDEILRDVRRIAREHPGLFLTGSVALGIAASRFAGASSRSPGTGRSGDAARSSGNGGDAVEKRAANKSSADGNPTTGSASGPRPAVPTSATARGGPNIDMRSASGPDNTEKPS